MEYFTSSVSPLPQSLLPPLPSLSLDAPISPFPHASHSPSPPLSISKLFPPSLKVIGTLLMITAFVTILIVAEYSPDFSHAVIGLVLTTLTSQQFLNGIV